MAENYLRIFPFKGEAEYRREDRIESWAILFCDFIAYKYNRWKFIYNKI